MDAPRILSGFLLVAVVAVIAFGVLRPEDRESPETGSIAAPAATTQPANPGEQVSVADDGEETPAPSSSPDVTVSADPTTDVPVLRDAPDLVDLDGWLQTDLTSLDQFEGKVVVLQFWTYSCSNCKATISNLQDIYATYGRDDLEIVGVHAPEFTFEEDPDNVAAAATDLGVSWPIALDTSKKNFHSWQEGRTAFWPRTYVIDRDGQIRFDHIGEGKYDELRETVAALVASS